VAEEMVVSWKASEGIKNLDRVHVVGVNNDSCSSVSSRCNVFQGAKNAKCLEIKYYGDFTILRGGSVETYVQICVPEAHSFGASVTIDCKISCSWVPFRRSEDVNSVRRFDVTSSPYEIVSNGIIYPYAS
jgi:hypothetical protein